MKKYPLSILDAHQPALHRSQFWAFSVCYIVSSNRIHFSKGKYFSRIAPIQRLIWVFAYEKVSFNWLRRHYFYLLLLKVISTLVEIPNNSVSKTWMNVFKSPLKSYALLLLKSTKYSVTLSSIKMCKYSQHVKTYGHRNNMYLKQMSMCKRKETCKVHVHNCRKNCN